uniref:Secreted peptide n=1 Tax=Sarcocystis aucheniae TaxID=65407 RepID=A0A5P9S4Q3_9APIC|nr:hypothetical protein [Sarcocystis aucheniae]
MLAASTTLVFLLSGILNRRLPLSMRDALATAAAATSFFYSSSSSSFFFLSENASSSSSSLSFFACCCCSFALCCCACSCCSCSFAFRACGCCCCTVCCFPLGGLPDAVFWRRALRNVRAIWRRVHCCRMVVDFSWLCIHPDPSSAAAAVAMPPVLLSPLFCFASRACRLP